MLAMSILLSAGWMIASLVLEDDAQFEKLLHFDRHTVATRIICVTDI